MTDSEAPLDPEQRYPIHRVLPELFRHHTFSGLDVLVSTEPEYPVVAYSRLDESPDIVPMDRRGQWTPTRTSGTHTGSIR
ncbi:hypothetical protein [Cryptosporangium minutisporangium]|uniref:Uncharacterized protein n=1 Tax=Cryptosporangium minutisporangium TaxID=113569 RepID=A0ABP6TA16_9ACTN